ncbi:MAG: type III pantothenate kinase [Bacteroidales bacterium]|nr:type III pantothenate kinase [Bacteroidales bacterium]
MSTKILVIDIGNTKSKLAISEDGRLISEVTLQDHETTVREALRMAHVGEVDGCMVSSVTDGSTKMVKRMRAGGLWTSMLKHEMRLPFQIGYATPQTLGTDRIAAVAGVVASFGLCDALVIDAGTAITYDFLTADGLFLGGAIAPGIGMRFRALHAFTSRLPLCDAGDDTGEIYGTDTRGAIAAGVMTGLRAETATYVAKARERNPQTKVILTGGDCKFFELSPKDTIFVRPNLVLEGLAHIASMNLDRCTRH